MVNYTKICCSSELFRCPPKHKKEYCFQGSNFFRLACINRHWNKMCWGNVRKMYHFQILEYKYEYQWVKEAFHILADWLSYFNIKTTYCRIGGGPRTPPPLPGQDFFIFTQFLGKIGQIVGWHPPPEVDALPTGKSWIRHCNQLILRTIRNELHVRRLSLHRVNFEAKNEDHKKKPNSECWIMFCKQFWQPLYVTQILLT